MEQKRLTLSEYDAIVAFDRLCFPEDHWSEEDWRELLADERAVYLALLDDGRIVGDVFVYNWQGERDYGKIMNLAVHPAYRGRRLAAGLLRAATELLQATGLPRRWNGSGQFPAYIENAPDEYSTRLIVCTALCSCRSSRSDDIWSI